MKNSSRFLKILTVLGLASIVSACAVVPAGSYDTYYSTPNVRSEIYVGPTVYPSTIYTPNVYTPYPVIVPRYYNRSPRYEHRVTPYNVPQHRGEHRGEHREHRRDR